MSTAATPVGNPGSLEVTTPSEREIALRRVFAAPRAMVFAALTRPELVKRWLLGPPGWSLAVCEIDLRVGGAFRYVWRRDDGGGTGLGMGGTYREVVAPERLVHGEAFDEAWYPGEAVVTTVLTERAGRTTLAHTILYESRAARDAVLESPMESGLAESHRRLDELLASLLRADGAAPGAPA